MTGYLDPRMAALTPQRLREIVEHGGGFIAREWEYTYPAQDGGDGVRGHEVYYLADASGQEIGNVGFAREADENGAAVLTLSDFWDERWPVDGADSLAIQGNLRAFLRFMSTFVPAQRAA